MCSSGVNGHRADIPKFMVEPLSNSYIYDRAFVELQGESSRVSFR
jgi:hypothetical protein